MKPKQKKPKIVYRILDAETGEARGSYSRACCDEFDFESAEEARQSNVHGLFEDRTKFKGAKYKVTYELLEIL